MKSSGIKSSTGYLVSIPGTYVGAGSTQLQAEAVNFRPVGTEWKLKGHCAPRWVDPTWFELGPDKFYNQMYIPLAVEICEGCPVMQLCAEAHNDLEKSWMVVGGKPPTSFKSASYDPEERFTDGNGVTRWRYCKQGHDKKNAGMDGNGHCRQCRREQRGTIVE